MAQEITITKTDDHYTMQFDGGKAYPVPMNAIDTLDDDLTPEEIDESATFRGDYGGHKHCKTFDVVEITDGLDNDEDDEENRTTPDERDCDDEEDSGLNASNIEDIDAAGMEDPDVGSAAECLNATCNAVATVAVRVNTGQVRHYCAKHRRSADNRGHMIVVDEAEIRIQPPSGPPTDPGDGDDNSGKRTIADGGREEWLLYGQPADVIGAPDKVFARRNDDFVLFPRLLFNKDIVEKNEHVPGEIFLSGISADDGYFDIVDQLEPVDVDELIAGVIEETVFSEREAQMVVFGGWFGMDHQTIADHLGLSKHTVRNHSEAAKDRYQKAQATPGLVAQLP